MTAPVNRERAFFLLSSVGVSLPWEHCDHELSPRTPRKHADFRMLFCSHNKLTQVSGLCQRLGPPSALIKPDPQERACAGTPQLHTLSLSLWRTFMPFYSVQWTEGSMPVQGIHLTEFPPVLTEEGTGPYQPRGRITGPADSSSRHAHPKESMNSCLTGKSQVFPSQSLPSLEEFPDSV